MGRIIKELRLIKNDQGKDDSSDRSRDPTGACRLVKGGADFGMNLTIVVVYGK